MKRRLNEVIGLLEYGELLRIKDDLNKGGDGVRILVDNRLKEEIKKQNRFCTMCASKIEPESATKFTLIFGPQELEKEFSFCAMDCLEYFLNELKKIKLK